MDSISKQGSAVKDSSLSLYLSTELKIFVQTIRIHGLVVILLAQVPARHRGRMRMNVEVASNFMDVPLEILNNSFRESICVPKLMLTRIGKALERSLTRKISSRLEKERSLTLLFQTPTCILKGVAA
jgi:hypothetical protein